MHYLKRYEKFLESRPKRIFVRGCGFEKHHIIPIKIDPTLEFDKSNIIVLTPREHYIAHWMLAKIYGGKMWFAFNMMKRVIVSDTKRSVLYDKSRKYVVEQVKKSNTGRKASDHVKKILSDRMIGKVWCKDKNDESKIELMSNKDERFLTKQWIPVHCGTKRSEKTKENMRNLNGVRGKVIFNNGDIIKYFSKSDKIPDGFVKGVSDKTKNILSNLSSGAMFYHNPLTGVQKRCKNVDDIPDGFIKGRINGSEKGLATMNEKGLKQVLDLKSGKRIMVMEDDVKSFHVFTPSNGFFVIIGDYFIDSTKTFNSLVYDFAPELSKRSFEKIFKLHHNVKPSSQNFIIKYEGKSYKSLGVKLISYSEYEISLFENKKLIRRDNVSKFKKLINQRTFEVKG